MRAAARCLLRRLHALELYAEAFDKARALDKLEGFAGFYGPDFYGLPRSAGRSGCVASTGRCRPEFKAGRRYSASGAAARRRIDWLAPDLRRG